MSGVYYASVRYVFCLIQFSGNQFDAATAILKSLAGLKVDLAVESSVKLDECESNP